MKVFETRIPLSEELWEEFNKYAHEDKFIESIYIEDKTIIIKFYEIVYTKIVQSKFEDRN